MRRLVLFVLLWPALGPGAPALAGKPDPEAARDEAALRAAGLKTDDASLLEIFRSRTLPPEQRAQSRALVRGKPLELECAAVLKEPDPELRLPVALALLEARRPESLPALIDLVRDLPPGEAWKAEEALRGVAGEQAPRLVVSRETPPAR